MKRCLVLLLILTIVCTLLLGGCSNNKEYVIPSMEYYKDFYKDENLYINKNGKLDENKIKDDNYIVLRELENGDIEIIAVEGEKRNVMVHTLSGEMYIDGGKVESEVVEVIHYIDGEEYNDEELWAMTGGRYGTAQRIFMGDIKADFTPEAENTEHPGYFPVTDENYSTITELKAYVETFVTPELAQEEFYKHGIDGDNPLFVEIDGKLHAAMVDGPYITYEPGSLQLLQKSDTEASLMFNRTSAEGKILYIMDMIKVDGEWIITLAEPF